MISTLTTFEILIIEEQKIICLDLITQLQNKQCKVICCSNLDVLEKHVKQASSDLILTSCKMYKKLKEREGTFSFDKRNDSIVARYQNSDLLILNDALNIIASFSKPFNSMEIQLFTNTYLNRRT